MIVEFVEAFRFLVRTPGAGHKREDLAEDRPILFWPMRNYLILYKPNTNPLQIVTIVSGSQDVPSGALIESMVSDPNHAAAPNCPIGCWTISQTNQSPASGDEFRHVLAATYNSDNLQGVVVGLVENQIVSHRPK